MSEYQHYEFRAVAKPLTSAQQTKVRTYSSRATISSTSFVNVYNWGDFRGSVEQFMTDFFDAHLYWADWGTHIFSVRLPHGALDRDTAEQYLGDGSALEISEVHTGLLVTFRSDPEDWDKPELGRDWMDDLIAIYHDLMRGDLKSLYIAWLAGMSYDYDEDALDALPEPPQPSNLGTLSPALLSLAEFLRLDDDWLTAATRGSVKSTSVDPMEGLEGWLAQLPEPEKTQALLKVLRGEAADVISDTLSRYRTTDTFRQARDTLMRGQNTGRTLGDIRTAAQKTRRERQERQAQAEARRRAKREEQERRAREHHLTSLEGKEQTLWSSVAGFIQQRNRPSYTQAVETLRDLRDVYTRKGEPGAFQMKLAALRHEHSRKKVFIHMLRAAKLST
ncbi:MAG: hypothetical protein AAFS10_01725 [Myxococcota bacterium]